MLVLFFIASLCVFMLEAMARVEKRPKEFDPSVFNLTVGCGAASHWKREDGNVTIWLTPRFDSLSANEQTEILKMLRSGTPRAITLKVVSASEKAQ